MYDITTAQPFQTQKWQSHQRPPTSYLATNLHTSIKMTQSHCRHGAHSYLHSIRRVPESLLPLSTESFERKCKSVKLPNCCDSCIVSETTWSRHRQSCISAVFGSKTETLHRTNMVLSLDKQYAIGFVMTNDHSQSQCQDEIVATYLGIWRNDYDTII